MVYRLWRPHVHGVRVLALDGEGRVLLVRHSYGPARWTPPGGGMHAGEDPLLTAARELREETGCTLGSPRVVAVSEERFHGSRNTVNVVVGLALGTPSPDAREVVEVRFFALEALPDAMPREMPDKLRRWIAA